MADIFVYELIYRGPHNTGQAQFDITLGAMITDPFTGAPAPVLNGPMDLAAAQALGFDLSQIAEGLNRENADALAAAQAEVGALQQEKADLKAQVDDMSPKVAELGLAQQRIAELEGQLAEAKAQSGGG